MKPQYVSWSVRAGIFAVATSLLLALGIFFVQFVYWLKFDRWLDLITASGFGHPVPASESEQWRGVQKLLTWLVSAPVELATFAAGIILVVLYIAARMSARR